MKRTGIILLAALLLAACLAGCLQRPTKLENQIALKALSPEQQEIVSLIANEKQKILLFDYNIQEAYSSVEFWVQAYENGVPADPSILTNPFDAEEGPVDGSIAVYLNRIADAQWEFALSIGGSKISGTVKSSTIDGTFSYAFGATSTPVTIEDGKEIVLYTEIYTNDHAGIEGDQQRYAEQPELLSEYPYVQLIKCKFVK